MSDRIICVTRLTAAVYNIGVVTSACAQAVNQFGKTYATMKGAPKSDRRRIGRMIRRGKIQRIEGRDAK